MHCRFASRKEVAVDVYVFSKEAHAVSVQMRQHSICIRLIHKSRQEVHVKIDTAKLELRRMDAREDRNAKPEDAKAVCV